MSTPSVQQVRELMLKINSLEEQRDALERQVAARQPPAAADQLAPPGSATASDLPLQDQLLFKVSTQLCYLCCRTLCRFNTRSCNACQIASVSVPCACMTSASTNDGICWLYGVHVCPNRCTGTGV